MGCGTRLDSPVGSMNRRRFSPSATRCLLTVRWLIATPWRPSSKAIRDADHLRVRRKSSIAVITSGTVAAGERRGAEERSSSPNSPNWRKRLTHLEAHAREIPISAATWAIGRSAHRATSRRRPSTDKGALPWVTDGFLRLSGRGVWRFLILPPKNPSPRHLNPCRRLQRHDPQHLAEEPLERAPRPVAGHHVAPRELLVGQRIPRPLEPGAQPAAGLVDRQHSVIDTVSDEEGRFTDRFPGSGETGGESNDVAEQVAVGEP